MSSTAPHLAHNTRPPTGESAGAQARGRQHLRRFLRHRTAMLGAVLFLIFSLAALLAPVLSPHDPTDMNLGPRLTPPGQEFLLGLDSLGRDMLSRMLHGARISNGVGTAVTAIALIAGTAVGLAAGYYPGRLDSALMRVMDTLLSFPAILLAMALTAAFGMNLTNAIIALGIVYTPRFARLVRSAVLSLVEREFIQAARAVGADDLRVILKHVLPNVTAPILVQATFTFGQAIIAESALSFLGIGTQPPTPSWGLLLADARIYLTQALWYPLIPGSAIALVVLAVNLLGDGLRDVLDPNLTDFRP